MTTESRVCLLLDEHISPKVAKALRRRGIDARAVTEPEYSEVQGRPDQFVLQRASEEGRVVVTYNYADFTALHKEWLLKGMSHMGIALIARGQVPSNNQGAQVKALKAFARARSSYENQLVWVGS